MESERCNLSESLLFEARKATSASSSSSYYSSRIHVLMKLKSERGMSDKDAEIEASKTHWTEVESNRYYTPATSAREESSTSETGGESCGVEMTEEEWAELYTENVEEIRRLNSNLFEIGVNIKFFEIGGKVTGKMIAKGGQATIYEDWVDTRSLGLPCVWKVFEAGCSVRELRKQWLVKLHRIFLGANGWRTIFRGRLLEDGRFAFVMPRYWGDVRKMLDVRMEHNGNQYPPLKMEDGSYQEDSILRLWYGVAKGMKELHDEGTLHRDLKASNVPIESSKFFESEKEEDRLNPLEIESKFCYLTVADYECSIGVVGTRFWRAPEIMEALKNRTLDSVSNAYNPEADVYSYAMTCYEILTGYIPFEHPEDEGINIDHIIQGKRPTLPQYLKPWVMEFFHKCWHSEPSVRPTFTEIVEMLLSNAKRSSLKDIIF